MDDFRELFYSLPEDFRAVAYLPPHDVVVDIHGIKDKEARMAMCRRLNDLRRERLIPLASPSAKAFYQEDGFKCVPMSRITERHFWDLFHRLPIATTDASKWKAVLKYVESCPEKPKTTPSPKEVEWASAELVESPSLSGLPVTDARVSSPSNSAGLAGLQQLAVGSPAKEKTPGSSHEDDYAEWVKKRVDIDIAQFSLPTFEIDTRASRFPKKMDAQQALQTLPPLQAMGDVFKAVFGIYHRKLSKLIGEIGASRSKEGKALTKLCSDLNVEKDGSLAELLARLRASEIMRKPL